jgi:ABC-2 type transport system ATP-binding protein
VGLAHNIPEENIQQCIEETASLVEIENHLNKKAKTLSRGLRQRLAIGQTLIHGPEILFLDEPSSGLDPEARYQFSKLLLKLSSEGKTIIVSSHILSELEDYATDMLVLRDGKIQEHSAINQPESSDKRNMILTLAKQFEGTENILKNINNIFEIRINEMHFEFIFEGDSIAQHQLLIQLIDNGVPVCGLADSKMDLQEIYVNKYGTKERKKGLPNEN